MNLSKHFTKTKLVWRTRSNSFRPSFLNFKGVCIKPASFLKVLVYIGEFYESLVENEA